MRRCNNIFCAIHNDKFPCGCGSALTSDNPDGAIYDCQARCAFDSLKTMSSIQILRFVDKIKADTETKGEVG